MAARRSLTIALLLTALLFASARDARSQQANSTANVTSIQPQSPPQVTTTSLLPSTTVAPEVAKPAPNGVVAESKSSTASGSTAGSTVSQPPTSQPTNRPADTPNPTVDERHLQTIEANVQKLSDEFGEFKNLIKNSQPTVKAPDHVRNEAKEGDLYELRYVYNAKDNRLGLDYIKYRATPLRAPDTSLGFVGWSFIVVAVASTLVLFVLAVVKYRSSRRADL